MPKNEVTAVQHTGMGGLAGLIEVAVMQPTVMVKNCLQEGRPFPTNPLTYYRGVFINCGAMGPIIATQFGVNNAIEGLVRPLRPNGKLTNADTIGMAMMAGTSSSFVGCPAVRTDLDRLHVSPWPARACARARARHDHHNHDHSSPFARSPGVSDDCPAEDGHVDD